jgi:hypothetical protein
MSRVRRALVDTALSIAVFVVGGAIGFALGLLIGFGLDIPFPPTTRAQSLAYPLALVGWFGGVLIGGIWLQRRRDRRS